MYMDPYTRAYTRFVFYVSCIYVIWAGGLVLLYNKLVNLNIHKVTWSKIKQKTIKIKNTRYNNHCNDYLLSMFN